MQGGPVPPRSPHRVRRLFCSPTAAGVFTQLHLKSFNKKKKSNYTNQKKAAEVMKHCPLGFCFPTSCFCTLPLASSLTAGWEFPGEGVILSYALRADSSLLLGQAECQLPCQLRCALRVSANDQEGEGEAHAVLRGSLRRSRVLSPEHTVCKSLVRQCLLFSQDS